MLSRSGFITGKGDAPEAYSSPFTLRLTMSRFTSATMRPIGTGGFSTNAFAPSKPSSSPSNSAKIIEFSGGCALNHLAIASTAAVPDALSSAPL